jgi:multidrug efflux pump subunit AcrA (membrane-fusion protein)
MKERSMATENVFSGRKPRRGLWIVLLLLIAAGAGGYWFVQNRAAIQAHPAGKAVKYHCPMHPTVVSDKPGDCPICGMKLELVEEKEPNAPAPAQARKRIMYRSTMNRDEISDKPGKDSMGMDMVRFEVSEAGESTVSGRAVVPLTAEARQRMGLTLGTVVKRDLTRDIRTSARIVADETRLHHVTVKVEGYVQQLFVAVTGQAVKKGDPLMTIYSPQLVAAEREYLAVVQSGNKTLTTSARQHLEFWDVSDEQINRLEKTGEVEKLLTLYSPAGGWVLQRDIAAGHKVMPGEVLLSINDLSSVWGDAVIYESDMPYVQVGMPMELTLPYWADKTFQGKINFISPSLDPQTRTIKVRIDIPNADLLLKVDMYADARLKFPLGERLAVPEGAIMRTGEHTYAFRDAGDGRLIPVEIKVGTRSGSYFEVLSGLSENDHVVTSANFLVDSESSMRAALEAMSK